MWYSSATCLVKRLFPFPGAPTNTVTWVLKSLILLFPTISWSFYNLSWCWTNVTPSSSATLLSVHPVTTRHTHDQQQQKMSMFILSWGIGGLPPLWHACALQAHTCNHRFLLFIVFGVGLRLRITVTLVLKIIYAHGQTCTPSRSLYKSSVFSVFFTVVCSLFCNSTSLLEMDIPKGDLNLDCAYPIFVFKLHEFLQVPGSFCFELRNTVRSLPPITAVQLLTIQYQSLAAAGLCLRWAGISEKLLRY
mgnify:CR=1 FL=1